MNTHTYTHANARTLTDADLPTHLLNNTLVYTWHHSQKFNKVI